MQQINNTPHPYWVWSKNAAIDVPIQGDECVAFLVALKFSRFLIRKKLIHFH